MQYHHVDLVGLCATKRDVQALQDQMTDIQASLHNLHSLQMNQYVCEEYQYIYKILAKDNLGVWNASRYFPDTAHELLALNYEEMRHLQCFYKIHQYSPQSLPHTNSVPDPASILFLEIARTFGLKFWLKEELDR